ncbi:MAG: ribulose-phosphate 3-epimerase [Candidatus Aminicenantes bacterium]|nr:ribulose-phosphate 3-epimerase [Candidatus Aminicenantes bacterium]
MNMIAPSLLSADVVRIAEAVRVVERAGADLVHVDVMDGHYVPNLTFGPGLVKALKKETRLPLDVHLMVDSPAEVIPWFLEAGADWISFHPEASAHPHRDLGLVKSAGRKAGLALNPGTPLGILEELLADLDFVLLMCVNPGRGSQPFIEASRGKIRRLRRWIRETGAPALIEIDGGVSAANIAALAEDGAQVFVAGHAVFNHPDPGQAVAQMRDLVGRPVDR